MPKNWCFWTVVLEKTLESPLDSKEIKPVNPKGNQPWIFIGRTDAEAEALILRPPDAKGWLIEKHPDTGQDWRQEEKGMIQDEMIGWHHSLNEHELEQTSGDGEGQGSLACCSPRGGKESNMTEWLNNKRKHEIRFAEGNWDPLFFWMLCCVEMRFQILLRMGGGEIEGNDTRGIKLGREVEQ